MTALAAPPALRTLNLSVGYRARRVTRALFERVNVTVDPGVLVCVLGPNGIGKSTLLRTIANMQPALWGRVEVAGVDVRSLTPLQLARHLAVVLTERAAIERLSARRVVGLGRYPHSGWLGREHENDRSVVDWAIGAVGMSHVAERDFSRLSDGERQRVMIARALAQTPALLVLDEPTAFLDVPSRVELMGLLRQLTSRHRLAAVVSTHDLELALRTADIVWLLAPGGELVSGAPEDVVLSGLIAQAFEGRHIRFHPEERTFRLLTGDRGVVRVQGAGVRAAMARAVLERAGYGIGGPETDEGCALHVEVDESGWRASGFRAAAAGGDFASLAVFLNERGKVA